MSSIIQASDESGYAAAAQLFRDYAKSLDFSLCFQDFDKELTILPEMYGPPTGAILLVTEGDKYIGVAGLRKITGENTCEIKRMFIRPGHQGKGIGKALMARLLETARQLGYQTVKLDTLGERMQAAVKLYKHFGFEMTTPYNYNPHDEVVYFELAL